MPFQQNSELPARIQRNLPPEAQSLFRVTFNKALHQSKEEIFAYSTAWSMVKRRYNNSLMVMN